MADTAMFDMPVAWSAPWTVRPISRHTALAWFGRFHYSESMGAAGQTFGVFASDMLAAVQIGPPGGSVNTAGIAEKFGLVPWPGNREVTRVACHPDAPRNTASRSIAMVLRELRAAGLAWVYSYADVAQGHHGGIYQALNGVYLGVSVPRPGYVIDGRQVHPRQVVSMYGSHSTATIERLAAGGVAIERVPDLIGAKHLYVLAIGGPASRRAIRRQLGPFAVAYPKRDVP